MSRGEVGRKGRPRRTRRGRVPTRLVILFVLPALLAGPALAQGDGNEDGSWRFVARAPMGADHAVELWTRSGSPDPLPPGEPVSLRFDVLWQANATPVSPGPDLLLSVAQCRTQRDAAEPTCDPGLVNETETRYVLLDADAAGGGVYAWRSDPHRAFGSAGIWRVLVAPESGVGGPAGFLLDVQDRLGSVQTPWVRDIVRALFGEDVGPVGQVLAFLAWLVIVIVSAKLLTRILRKTLFAPYRMDPTVGRLAMRLVAAIWIILGIAFALWSVWRVNFWAGLAALGLLSVALGFGMQNTVANIMGGVNLALDKPFVIGDRVRIGETWGEVEEVGMRSTRILTTRKEVVIVPNKLMDEREIWNYTIDQPELRRDVEVLISYDSDRALAEALMIEAAREHQEVLPYPRPRVLLRGFAESGVRLELRCWIPDARNLRPIGSDLRKAIQDKFNAHGVEIPYPYRTLVEKKELPKPKHATRSEVAAHLPPDERLPRLLYATAGPEPLARTANLVARIAHSLDMRLLVLHIQPRMTQARRAESYRIFSAFESAAARHQVPVTTIAREGTVVEEIKAVIQEESVDLLLIGSSRSPFRWAPRKVADLTREIRESAKVPVMIVPRNLRITSRALDHYRAVVEKRSIERQRREDQLPEPDGAGAEAEEDVDSEDDAQNDVDEEEDSA